MTSMRRAARKNPRLKEGDVFQLSMPNGKVGLGQVMVTRRYSLYVAIYEGLYSTNEMPLLAEKSILFVGWTSDELIFHGQWKIVGNHPFDRSRIPMPNYRMAFNGISYVVSFEEVKLRLATPNDLEFYKNKSSRSGIGFQDALEAHYGFQDWDESRFGDLKSEYAAARSATVPPTGIN